MQVAAIHSPRLRMGHLLIGIVGCAVGFAAYRSIAPSRLTTPRALAIVTGYSLGMGTALGAILTGCGLMADRRRRGDASYPSRAGHWLLLLGLGAASADVAAVAAYWRWTARDPDWHAHPVTPYLAQFDIGGAGTGPAMDHHAAGWGVGAMVALGFLRALRRRLAPRWLAVFVVFALVGATLAVGHLATLVLSHYPVDTRGLNRLLVHVYAGSVLLGAVAIVAAVVGDRRSREPADGLHRLGVVAWLGIAAIQLVMYVLWLGRF